MVGIQTGARVDEPAAASSRLTREVLVLLIQFGECAKVMDAVSEGKMAVM